MEQVNHGQDKWAPYPFAYKAQMYRSYTDAQLTYARADAALAADAMRGMTPNKAGLSPAGWYTDDAATIGAEIDRRVAARKRR